MAIDYNIPEGRLGYQQSGAQCRVVFTPGAERDCGRPQVEIWSSIGSGSPEYLWNGRATSFGNVQGKDGEDVERILREHEAELLELDELYLGSELNAQANRIGKWQGAEDGYRATDDLEQTIAHALNDAASYWDVADYFDPAETAVLEELRQALERGETVEDFAAHECSEARLDGALIDEDEAAEWLAERALAEGIAVQVETMPDCWRADHRKANNWGVYPHNGAERRMVTPEQAEEIIGADPDGYAHVVEVSRG